MKNAKRILSGVLALGLVAALLPGMSMTAKAAQYTGTSTGALPTHVKAYSNSNATTEISSVGDIERGGDTVQGVTFYLKAESHYQIDGTPDVTYGITHTDSTTTPATVTTKVQSGTNATVQPVSGQEGVYRVFVAGGYTGANAADVIAFNFGDVTVKPITHNATIAFDAPGTGKAGTPTTPADGKPNETENFVFPIKLNEGYMLASSGDKVKVDWVGTTTGSVPTANVAVVSNTETDGTVTVTGSGNQIIGDIKVTIRTEKKKYSVTKSATPDAKIGTDTVPTDTVNKYEHGTNINLEFENKSIKQITYTVKGRDINGQALSTTETFTKEGTNGKFNLGQIKGDIEITDAVEDAAELTVAHGSSNLSSMNVTAMKGTKTIPQLGNATTGETATSGKDYTFTITAANNYVPGSSFEVTVTGADTLKYNNDDDDTNDDLKVDYSGIPEIKVTVPGDKMSANITAIVVAGLVQAAKITPGEGVSAIDSDDALMKDKDGNLYVDTSSDVEVTLTPESGKAYADGAETSEGLTISNNKITIDSSDLNVGTPYEVKVEEDKTDASGNVIGQNIINAPNDPANGGTTDGNGQPEDASTPGSAGAGDASGQQPNAGGDGSAIDTGFADNDQIADYAKPFVKAAADAGIIKGVGNNRFDPMGTATRAAFSTMVARAKGLTAKKESSKFADVTKAALGDDLFNGVLACEDLDPAIVKGYPDGTFQPTKAVTRAEGILMIWRAAGSPAYTGADKFNDMADWYKDAANWGAEQGIVNGVGNNAFNGNGTLTRQDLATMLGRAIQKGVITPEQAAEIEDEATKSDETKTEDTKEGEEATEGTEEKTEDTAA